MPQLDINLIPNLLMRFIISFLGGYFSSTFSSSPKTYRNSYTRREILKTLSKTSEFDYGLSATILTGISNTINYLREVLTNENYRIIHFTNTLIDVEEYILLNSITRTTYKVKH